jgi:multidrug efflux pump subunit AcrB
MESNASESYSKVNGEHAISFMIQKQSNFATTDVVKSIHKELNSIRKDHQDIEIFILMDQAEYINLSVNSVLNNLLIGGLLAIIILYFFLREIKPTIIIGLAIPVSVIAAFILIYFSGITLNVISMGGLALGIGMLVDNSIVVIENIYRLRHEGASVKEAAIVGASQVAGAITSSTLTTVAVFLPIVFMQGLTAQIFKELALTITYSLGASLVIALTLVPTMASKMLIHTKESSEGKVLKAVKRGYTRVLKFTLNHKIITLVSTIVLFGLSIFLSYNVGTELFPATEQTQVSVTVEMPEGTEFEAAVEITDQVVDEIQAIKGIKYVGANIGGSNLMMMGGMGGSSSTQATINIVLEDDTNRKVSDVSKDIEALGLNKPYLLTINQQMDMSTLGGSGVEIVIKGPELDQLKAIAEEIGAIVESVEGTEDVDNGISLTSPELKITVNREASIANGLTTAQIYMIIAEMLKEDAAVTNLSLDGNQYDIKVKNNSGDQAVTVDMIKNLMIPTPFGTVVKLKDIANVTEEAGFGTITRHNQSRTLTVTATIADGYNSGKVGAKVAEEVAKYDAPNGYLVDIKGEQEQIQSTMNDLILALILAVVLIYMIMAAQFQSLLFPFIVMFTIPLAFTGGFLGLFITNTPISMVAFIGLIILAGIVVNNGIVLVDYINQLKSEGKTTHEAVIEAGNTRLRPIIMTALTTILGLAAMALGIGEGSEMMQPMAITTIGGLIYATLLTLIIVPIIYAGLDKFRGRKARDDR